MSTKTYTGHGQAGVWTDVNNWSGLSTPGTTDLALFSGTGSQAFSGTLSAGTIMLLGAEAVTFNGTVNTYDAGFCVGIMVCNGGSMTFSAGSRLNDNAGALLVGNAATGRFTAVGTVQHATTINSANATVGKLAGTGVGTVTIDGATWNCGTVAFVGFGGTGTLDVKDGGIANIGGNLAVAFGGTSTGTVTVEAGSTINVGGAADFGQVHADGAPGTATVTVNAGGTLNVGYWLFVGPTSTLSLNGGTVNLGTSGQGWIDLEQGGVVSGHGTLTSTSNLLWDCGAIDAQGGKLEIAARLAGTGSLNIGANSTAKLDGPAVQIPAINFTGPGSSLEFQGQPWSLAQINGFAPGDQIVFDSMIDSVKWQPSSGSLCLVGGGTTVDTLHLGGMAANAAFTVQHSNGSSIISLHS